MLKRGGIFKHEFLANLLQSLRVTKNFENRIIIGEVMTKSLVSCFLTHGVVSDIHISQGSVATYFRCGGIFRDKFVANLPMSLSVKGFLKSVNIWGSYGQEFSVLFFIDSRCSVQLCDRL